jgi:2-amino-4-hydroxy-6-hydroxymethyldihydropteridine diphosphokinase
VLSVSLNPSVWRSNVVEMDEHRVYLNIGSNIEPERNLPKAVELLGEFGKIEAASTAWETRAVGTSGPNFLNACVFLRTALNITDFKTEAIQPVESALGRVRGPDKYAPRPIDLDIVMWDGKALRVEQWNFAYIVLPMAELAPELEHPITHEKLFQAAEKLRAKTWALPHPEVLRSIDPD